MRKKKLLTMTCLAMVLTGCTTSHTSGPTINTDQVCDYAEPIDETDENIIESTPNKLTAYVSMANVTEIGDFQEISWETLLKFLNGETNGTVYIGYGRCTNCEAIITSLNDAAVETGATIYYVNARFAPEDELYNEIMDGFNDDEIVHYDNDGKRTMSVPMVMSFLDGTITGRVLYVPEDLEVDDNDNLTDESKETLKNRYIGVIHSCGN